MASKQTRIKGDKHEEQGQPQSKHNQAILTYGGFVREIPAAGEICMDAFHRWHVHIGGLPVCGIGGVSHACRGSAACYVSIDVSCQLFAVSVADARSDASNVLCGPVAAGLGLVSPNERANKRGARSLLLMCWLNILDGINAGLRTAAAAHFDP